MTTPIDRALATFDAAIASARTPEAAYAALEAYAVAVVGAKLFTVMTIDLAAGLARRAHTSDPDAYPVSGAKPIQRDAWFRLVHDERRPFVANTIGEIADVFPDHGVIESLGCGSVLNLPVVVRDEVVATVNLLHEARFYTPERVERAVRWLPTPARLAYLIAA